jgi:hypothetical protein
MARIPLLAGVFLLACQQPTPPAAKPGSSTTSPELSATIVALDSAMFSAFNAHDAELLATFFTADLEFYHDKGGLAGFDSTMAGFRGLFERNKDSGLRRDLVPGTLEVYPLGDHGALAVCQHRFCHVENGADDCGTFKNIMVWRKQDNGWKVSRVISYDH